MRQEYEISLKQRMNSPSINQKSRDKKYSKVPFYERLYTPKNKNQEEQPAATLDPNNGGRES
jgi:hypothetical protein